MVRRFWVPAVVAVSLLLNVTLFVSHPGRRNHITAEDGNSRSTYFSVHEIAAAQAIATGKGVKIGIIDHYFGYEVNRAKYAGGKDFAGDDAAFRNISEHGLWLATTLREISPGAAIYALNATGGDEERKVTAMVEAIRWAVAEGIDILTYSDRPISAANRPRLDAAVAEAVRAGVICIFIHYPHPENILPLAMFASETYDREPDVNIWLYDYNVIFVREYFDYKEKKAGVRPYLSLSSTSVVTAGVVAMMKEADPSLTPADCRRLLVETSRPCTAEAGGVDEAMRLCPRVVDAAAAVRRARDGAAVAVNGDGEIAGDAGRRPEATVAVR
jgi:hypothetical protein